MILAAGRGERMRPFTDAHPKPLATVAAKALIEYHVERLAIAGIERVVINIAWLGDQIKDALGDGRRYGVEILYSDEGALALDTGGGILQALPMLGSDPFWAISADLWTDYRLLDSRAILARDDLAHLVMVANPEFHPQGDFSLECGRISDDCNGSGTRLTFGSISILAPALFADCRPGKFSVVPLWLDAMRKGRVSGELFAGVWHNIGTMAQLLAVNQAARAPSR